MVKLRPATNNDVINLYGTTLNRTMKAITATIDGKAIGIGGIYYTKTNANAFAFANITPELRKHKLAIYKASRKILEIIKKETVPVYSVADKRIPGSEDLLMNMGFVYVNETKMGPLYQWTA